jgi:ribosome-associated protein
MAGPLIINDALRIPAEELRLAFARSSGPGGQNVNKVNSKAVLRWSVRSTLALPEDVKLRFLQRYAARLTRDGELVLSADEHREQGRNAAACRERLRQLVLAVAKPPVPRRPTRPTRGSQQRRLGEKKLRGQRKADRRPPTHE